MSLRGAGRRRWNLPDLRSQIGATVALVIVAAVLLLLTGPLWFPIDVPIHSDLKLLPYNRGGVVITGHEKGCGSYRDTRQIGRGVGAKIQLAAGFCWNGKRVRWTWGLHRNDCYPRETLQLIVDRHGYRMQLPFQPS